MNVINHGKWERHKPKKGHPDAPPNTMYARNDKGDDWYDYIRGEHFKEGSVKIACAFMGDLWVVGPAVYEADRLFPANQMVLEITDYEGDDPQRDFGGKSYNADSNEFKTVDLNASD